MLTLQWSLLSQSVNTTVVSPVTDVTLQSFSSPPPTLPTDIIPLPDTKFTDLFALTRWFTGESQEPELSGCDVSVRWPSLVSGGFIDSLLIVHINFYY